MNDNRIVVVSGFQRCGSSLTMRMLHHGGMAVYADHVGTSYETDDVLRLPRDHGWLEKAQGKAIKILEPQRFSPPKDLEYLFIWLDRDPRQMARSAVKFMSLLSPGLLPNKRKAVKALTKSYLRERRPTVSLLRSYPDAEVQTLKFETIINSPYEAATLLDAWVGGLDVEAMAAQVVQRSANCHPDMLELQWAGR